MSGPQDPKRGVKASGSGADIPQGLGDSVSSRQRPRRQVSMTATERKTDSLRQEMDPVRKTTGGSQSESRLRQVKTCSWRTRRMKLECRQETVLPDRGPMAQSLSCESGSGSEQGLATKAPR